MKTTIEIHDELLLQAKGHAKNTGRSLRAVVEEGLRTVLHSTERRPSYRLPDLRVGDPAAENPLASYSWPELRETIYGDPGKPVIAVDTTILVYAHRRGLPATSSFEIFATRS